jgi:hypothetical protein
MDSIDDHSDVRGDSDNSDLDGGDFEDDPYKAFNDSSRTGVMVEKQE